MLTFVQVCRTIDKNLNAKKLCTDSERTNEEQNDLRRN